MELAILGCGTIGGGVIKAIGEGHCPGYHLGWVIDPVKTASARLAAERLGATWLTTPAGLPGEGGPDVVLEAASAAAARQHVPGLLQRGITTVIMSVGALVDQAFLDGLLDTARRAGTKLVVPSGALGGLDVVRAARALGGLREVRVTTTKAPRGLAGAPYFATHPVALESLTERTLIFAGTAREAIPAFPANVNILCSVSLAGLGPDCTYATIYADPAAPRTVHVLEASGDFGQLRAEFENFPSPDNPKSSYLATLSAVAALQRLREDLVLS